MLLINATYKKFGLQKYGFQGDEGKLYERPRDYFCKKLAMSEREWFKDWFNSPYYHKLYFEHDEKEAQQFITGLLDYLCPQPASRMLDIACGKGRHSRFLASKGFDVTGFDLSLESIAYAKQFENEHLHFYRHDVRLPFWINYFDYAFNFFTSFGYFHTRREHDAAMRSIAYSLKSQGTLLIDYLNVHYVEEHLVHNEVKKIDDTYYEIHRWQNDTHFYKRIIVTNPSLDRPAEFTEKVAKFSLGDFTDMLSFQKMQVKQVFGDYRLNAYDVKKTPRMIIVAERTRKTI
jgi:SAM-dependent methyltransferase